MVTSRDGALTVQADDGTWLAPAQLAAWLEGRGPVFIKIGQFLALRPELLPQEYCDAFLNLLDRVPPFPWAVAREILVEDLGGDPETLFDWINPTPVASASLAQVHMARTHGGEDVAVKVQRPAIRDAVEHDLQRARWLFRLLNLSGTARIVDLDEVLGEFRRWLNEELDCQRELRNLERMRAVVRPSDPIRIPKPYPELSGPRVVTMEFLRGIPFSELLALARKGRFDRIERLGLDPDELAAALLRAVLIQIFHYQTFHADVHPGNVLAVGGGTIGFVDFGLIDVVDESVRQRQSQYLEAVYRGDVEEMYRSLTDLLISGPRTDMEAFRIDFVAATRTWLRERAAETAGTSPSAGRSSIARYLIEVMRVAREHDLRFPADVLSLYRTLLTAETLANQLSDQADLGTVGRAFFVHLRFQSTLEALSPDRVQSVALDLVGLLEDAPGQLRRLLANLSEDRFTASLRTYESAADRRHASARARLTTVATLSIGVAILSVGTNPGGPLETPVRATLWGVLLALYLWIAVLWRRLP